MILIRRRRFQRLRRSLYSCRVLPASAGRADGTGGKRASPDWLFVTFFYTLASTQEGSVDKSLIITLHWSKNCILE